MNNIEIVKDGVTYTFRVRAEEDTDCGPPWKECDGHGPVSEWTTRKKRPGERILNKDGTSRRYYDVEGATKQAWKEGWGIGIERLAELAKELGRAPTCGEIVAKAVELNFDYLHGWCNNEWHYQCLEIRLLDEEGEETDVVQYLGMVEDSDDGKYMEEQAREMAEELMTGLGTVWGVKQVTTYGLL